MEIDIIYFGDLGISKVGAAEYIRNIYSEALNQGDLVECYDRQGRFTNTRDNKVDGGNKKASSRLRHLLIRFSGFSVIAVLLFYFKYWRNASRAIAAYRKEKSVPPKSVYFHDIFSAYLFVKRVYTDENVVLTLGNNGDAFKMIVDQLPSLRLFKGMFRKRERFLYSCCHRIIVLSNDAKRSFETAHGTEFSSKLFVLFNAVPDIKSVSLRQTRLEPVRFISVGTISHRKGHDLLLEAISKLKNSAPGRRIELHLLGSGVQYFEELIETFDDISDIVFYHGAVSDVHSYLEKADCFILASRDEGMPLSVLEAMRTGLPVITSNAASLPEIVDSDLGYIFNSGSSESLYFSIDEFLSLSESDFLVMCKKSRSRYEAKFTLPKHYKELRSHFF